MARYAFTPGTFCWIELGTTDQAKAKEFYGRLLGWDFEDSPMPQGGHYTMFKRGGGNIAGMYELSREMHEQQGIPPHWMPYVAVESADAAADRAKQLGGKVTVPPFDVMDVGRMTVVQDPTGAVLSLWQKGNHHGFDEVGDPGSLCWAEIATPDPDRAGSFYAALFDWGKKPSSVGGENYTEFTVNESSVGGMLPMEGAKWEGVPPHWMIYFAVKNCRETADEAVSMGATLELPPTLIPGVGQFALVKDPQGAMFSIVEMGG
jgi:predicted enzyme related to lactoylglutathione lyase